LNLLHQPVEEAVFGTGTGDNANLSHYSIRMILPALVTIPHTYLPDKNQRITLLPLAEQLCLSGLTSSPVYADSTSPSPLLTTKTAVIGSDRRLRADNKPLIKSPHQDIGIHHWLRISHQPFPRKYLPDLDPP